jgi:hypothetical protein
MKMSKKKVVLALVAMFGLVAESSASGGVGISAGSVASTELGISTGSGASTNLGTSTGLGVSAGTGVLSSTSGLTALDAGVAATVPAPATTKVTLDSPALGVTSEVVAAQAIDNTSTITVGAPAVDAITSKGDVTVPKLNLTADADASTSTGLSAWVASATATTNTGISAVLGTDVAYAGADIAGQSTNTFDSSTIVEVENVLPVQLAITGDAAVSAVPEANEYAMLLAGLGLMGFMVNRRKEKLK